MPRARASRWIAAIATAVAVHAALLIGMSWIERPPETPQRFSPVEPLFVDLAPRPPDQPRPRAVEAARAAPRSAPRPAPESLIAAPGPLVAPTAPAQPAPPSGGGSGKAPGPLAGEGLNTSDCPPDFRPRRPGDVRADPCAFRGRTRDHLPVEIAQQTAIAFDKAAYYDRVLAARKSPGSPPGLICVPGLSKKNKPRNTLKLGPLPCVLIPPVGSLNPEMMVEPIPPKNPVRSDEEFAGD